MIKQMSSSKALQNCEHDARFHPISLVKLDVTF